MFIEIILEKQYYCNDYIKMGHNNILLLSNNIFQVLEMSTI